MSLLFADGKFHSIAKADCEFCGGCGICMQQAPHVKGEGITLRFGFCRCIEVEIVDAGGKVISTAPKAV